MEVDVMPNHNKTKNRTSTVLGIAMSLGLVLGGLVGLAVDNMIIFAGGGMILGLAIGLALEKRKLSQH
jgi:hypothetical protein